MVRVAEQQMEAQKKHLEERTRRFAPVQRELVAALRKSPELAGVVGAIDAAKKPHRRSAPPQAKKRPFAPQKTLVRLGSIHIVEALPFFPFTWSSQTGLANEYYSPLTADGTTGDMGFAMSPGTGTMACQAALGAQVAIPNSPCMINFTATPSVNWMNAWWSSWVVSRHGREHADLGGLVQRQELERHRHRGGLEFGDVVVGRDSHRPAVARVS
jgi:hypothetical protein